MDNQKKETKSVATSTDTSKKKSVKISLSAGYGGGGVTRFLIDTDEPVTTEKTVTWQTSTTSVNKDGATGTKGTTSSTSLTKDTTTGAAKSVSTTSLVKASQTTISKGSPLSASGSSRSVTVTKGAAAVPSTPKGGKGSGPHAAKAGGRRGGPGLTKRGIASSSSTHITGRPRGYKGKGGPGRRDDDDLDTWIKSRQLIKPDDQLELTEAELGEEVTRILLPQITNVIENLLIYSFKDRAFNKITPPSSTVILYNNEGIALHTDSEEAKLQMEDPDITGYTLPPMEYLITEPETQSTRSVYDGDDDDDDDDDADTTDGHLSGRAILKKAGKSVPKFGSFIGLGPGKKVGKRGKKHSSEKSTPSSNVSDTDEYIGEEEQSHVDHEGDRSQDNKPSDNTTDVTDVSDVKSTTTPPPGKKRKLINQFNFCERAVLTYMNPKRSIQTQTIAPSRSQYSNQVVQWIIYDNYVEDYEFQQKEREKKEEKKSGIRREVGIHPRDDKTISLSALNEKYLRCWHILERIVNQNIFKEVAHDYRYWDDPSDEFREGEGTLLPLWKFQYERTRKLMVTNIVFNPTYYDLFGICYGSLDFVKQPNEGYLCFFTIKNPSFPDYIIATQSGVMCCDIHTKYPYLAAIGLYDGNILLFDLKEDCKRPLYDSFGARLKHRDCVWEIKWAEDTVDGEVNFFSVGSSGEVLNWILAQNRLDISKVVTIFVLDGKVEGPDSADIYLTSCCTCMKFDPNNPNVLIVATEEGTIYKCCMEYTPYYLLTFEAHNLPVYSFDYNRYNNRIFITCSGDWRIKIWEDMYTDPLFIFDIGTPIGDVKWAPYSSTVFAAITYDGTIQVFDISINKYKPICVQAVVPKQKSNLTKLTFNYKLPFILVGDDKGIVTSMKLSPNLRLMVKPPKKQVYTNQAGLQTQKLQKLLSFLKDVPESEFNTDIATTVKS